MPQLIWMAKIFLFYSRAYLQNAYTGLKVQVCEQFFGFKNFQNSKYLNLLFENYILVIVLSVTLYFTFLFVYTKWYIKG